MDPSAALFVIVFLSAFTGFIYLGIRLIARAITVNRPIRPGSDEELRARINRVDHDRLVAEYRRESADRP